MATAIVKLKLVNSVVMGAPGDIISVWGHKFTVNEEFECVCEMPEDMARSSADAGRVEIIKISNEDSTEIIPIESILKRFGNDPNNYFGLTDSMEFRKEISRLTKWQLIDFANQKLRIELAHTSSKSKLIADTCTAVENIRSVA